MNRNLNKQLNVFALITAAEAAPSFGMQENRAYEIVRKHARSTRVAKENCPAYENVER